MCMTSKKKKRKGGTWLQLDFLGLVHIDSVPTYTFKTYAQSLFTGTVFHVITRTHI